MTDNEIIKAFKCCIDFVSGGESMCNDCPLHDYDNCSSEKLKQALDLINRQKAEIERLQTRNDELNNLNKTVSQEAIKGFAHLLIDKAKKGVIYAMDIPDYVKEMVGE